MILIFNFKRPTFTENINSKCHYGVLHITSIVLFKFSVFWGCFILFVVLFLCYCYHELLIVNLSYTMHWKVKLGLHVLEISLLFFHTVTSLCYYATVHVACNANDFIVSQCTNLTI